MGRLLRWESMWERMERMARGLEAGGFLFGLEVVVEEEGGMTWLFLLLLLGKKKGRGVQLGCRGDRFVRDGSHGVGMGMGG